MAIKKTNEQFIKEICDKYSLSPNDFKLSEYLGWDKPISFTCNRCGATKTIAYASALLKKNKNHSHVCRCYSYSDDWIFLRKKYLAWIKTQNQYDIINDSNYSIHPSILVRCRKCNCEQKRSPSSLIKDGCLCCGENPHGIKCSLEWANKQLNDAFFGEYEFIGDWQGTHRPCLTKHKNCGFIYTVSSPIDLIIRKKGLCPKCKKISQGEKIITSIFENNKINFIYQYRFEEWKNAPYDFYLPGNKILIEFQGRQHFEPVSKFGGKDALIRQKEIDKKKKELAQQKEIKILYFTYLDMPNLKEKVVQRLSQEGVELNLETIAISNGDEDIV